MIRKSHLTDAERAYNGKLLERQKYELKIAAIERKLKKETDPDSPEWETLWDKRLELEQILEDMQPEIISLHDAAKASRNK